MITLVLGGARSGKSRYAVELCREVESEGSPVVFIATATNLDEEMTERIARHRAERPSSFRTVEAPLELAAALAELPPGTRVLVDCLTIWISNWMFELRELDRDERESRILAAVEEVAAKTEPLEAVIVSNEVGQGLVPETAVGREFRDLVGTANQRVAAKAERVVLVVAGIPTPLR